MGKRRPFPRSGESNWHPLLGIDRPAPSKHTLAGADHKNESSSFIKWQVAFPASQEGSDVMKRLVWRERFLLDLLRLFA